MRSVLVPSFPRKRGTVRRTSKDDPRAGLPPKSVADGAYFTLSTRRPGGEGRVRGADEPVRGSAHLTFPDILSVTGS
jgi:hypothetical protein